jgi:hypothetical protein
MKLFVALFATLLLIHYPAHAALKADKASFGSFTKRHASVLRTNDLPEHTLSSTAYSNINYFQGKITPMATDTTLVKPQATGAPAIIGDVFNFPNPFKMSEGTTFGYELSQDLDIEIEIYNIRGQRIWKTHIQAGDEGGLGGGHYNQVPFGSAQVDGFPLPSTVYFYVIKHQGKSIGKGKMAITP